ncbi:MAG: hypothetical protein H6999_05350 [Hahellaceae bacterium]|nr:hypothetical protein [Hahellaceae bacterium]MCP5169164.1 hypothetical protein [Hahellaceae bacterium]
MDRPVNVVIFASREKIPTLTETILCAINSVPDGSVIDVLINGNQELAEQIAREVVSPLSSETKPYFVWSIPVADKGNAWNQHIHEIWRGELNAVYIDGYVRVTREAIAAISHTFASEAAALGTSGVPTSGASAKAIRRQMAKQGGFHGNLCAIKSWALEQIRARGIRIPTGMYRVDSIMGAFLSFGLDNQTHEWDPFRFLPLTHAASWRCDKKKWYRFQDVVAWNSRRDRQARGDIENAAVKFHLADSKILPEGLPQDVRSLILSWSETCPSDARNVTFRSKRHAQAMAFIHGYAVPAPGDLCARQVFTPKPKPAV